MEVSWQAGSLSRQQEGSETILEDFNLEPTYPHWGACLSFRVSQSSGVWNKEESLTNFGQLSSWLTMNTWSPISGLFDLLTVNSPHALYLQTQMNRV